MKISYPLRIFRFVVFFITSLFFSTSIYSIEVVLKSGDIFIADFVSEDENSITIKWKNDTYLLPESEGLKAFGYLVGLGHCKTGETANDCKSRMGTDPDTSSVMYKFPQIGKKDSISNDDMNGIQAIYGVRNLPFPTSGKYVLNYKDIESIQMIQELENYSGYSTEADRVNYGKFLNNYIAYNFKKTHKTIWEQYDNFYNTVKAESASYSQDDLARQREILTQGIVQGIKLKEDGIKGYHAIDSNFINYVIQKHSELRNFTIDLQGE